MRHYLSLIRPVNGMMAVVAVWLGYALAKGGIAFSLEAGYACAAAFLILSGGMAANDFFDRKIDKKNKPHRPIPSGKVRARHALMLSLALFIIGLGLAGLVNLLALGIAVIASVLLFAYAETLSRHKHVGNAVVALSTGLTFVFGEAVTGSIGSPVVVILAFIALFSSWAREIYKDIEDMRADRRHRLTLPLAEGIVHSSAIAGAFLLIAVALTPIPFFLGLLPVQYLTIICAVDLGLLAIALTAPFEKTPARFHTYGSAVKLLQGLALVGFFTGII